MPFALLNNTPKNISPTVKGNRERERERERSMAMAALSSPGPGFSSDSPLQGSHFLPDLLLPSSLCLCGRWSGDRKDNHAVIVSSSSSSNGAPFPAPAPAPPPVPAPARTSALARPLLEDIQKEEQYITPQTVPIFSWPHADPKKVLSIILGGGAGTRLFPLTRRRAKPAVPTGGGYRLIDVPMSNCINSGINKIFILTQFNSASLNRHLVNTYNFGNGVNFGDGFVEALSATQRPGKDGMKWFQGTADAVRQFTWIFEDNKNKDLEHVLILSGDHLYRMDYMDFIQKHQETGADITISCVPIDESRASDYGLMKIDNRGQILYFREKPTGDDLKAMQVDTSTLGLSPEEARTKPYIASMGIYVFRKDILLKLLSWRFPTLNDFGSEIIPAAAKEYNVQAYLFDDYWEDIGTIKSFYNANLALTAQPSKFEFYDANKPIFTSPQYLPPTKINKCRVVDSIISHGCFIQECSIEHSVIGNRSRLESGVEIKDSVMMGADSYETEAERAGLLAEGKVPVGVGENTIIRTCIIDKNARIGKNVIIANKDNVQEADRPSEGYYIRSGIIVILKNSIIKDGTVI